jgi:hypothetical protein
VICRTASLVSSKEYPMSERKAFVGLVPTIFVNRYYVSVTPSVTRITFCDQPPLDEITPHTWIVMLTADAVALANLIKKLTDDNRRDYPESYGLDRTSP